jgi:hypothetical protein
MPRKNFISGAFGIKVPFDNDEISAKSTYNACPDQDRTPHTQNDLVQIRSSRHNVLFSYGILERCRQLGEWYISTCHRKERYSIVV